MLAGRHEAKQGGPLGQSEAHHPFDGCCSVPTIFTVSISFWIYKWTNIPGVTKGCLLEDRAWRLKTTSLWLLVSLQYIYLYLVFCLWKIVCTLLIKGWVRHILGILIVVIPQILNLCPTFLDKAFEELAPNVAGLIVGVSWLRIRCIFQVEPMSLCHVQIWPTWLRFFLRMTALGTSKYSCSHNARNAPCGLWKRGLDLSRVASRETGLLGNGPKKSVWKGV